MIHAIFLLMIVSIMFTYRVTVSNGELPIELLYQMVSYLSRYCVKWRVTYRVTVSNGELPIELLCHMARCWKSDLSIITHT